MLSFKHCFNNNTAGGKGIVSIFCLFIEQATVAAFCCGQIEVGGKADKPLPVPASAVYQKVSLAKSEHNLDRDKSKKTRKMTPLTSSNGCSGNSRHWKFSPACAPSEGGRPQPFSQTWGRENKAYFPKRACASQASGVLLRLYSQPAWQRCALQHCTFQTLMNWSSQTLCEAGNHYLPFTDGELRHSKMRVICLEGICSRARNWTQTFQMAEHTVPVWFAGKFIRHCASGSLAVLLLWFTASKARLKPASL